MLPAPLNSESVLEPQRYSQMRAKIILDLLADTTYHKDEDLTNGMTLEKVIRQSMIKAPESTGGDEEATQNGRISTLSAGLSELDLRRFASPFSGLSAETQERLKTQINDILQSIVDFLYTDAEDFSAEDRLNKVRNLPDDIQSRFDQLAADQDAVSGQLRRIQELVTEINKIHPRLREELTHILTTFPPALRAQRSAADELAATTIETALLKLSLLRASAHRALYGYSSGSGTMAQALQKLHAKTQKDAEKLEREERKLDKQLADYHRLMQVEEPGGGFAQVVEDWIRVQRETEECRKDLRRLGWTGD